MSGIALCRVVLVRPHFPGNLGATARVMRNFGLNQLCLVSPIANPADPAARQMSTQGQSILDEAKIVADLGEAVADCFVVIGTASPRGGIFRRQSVGPPEAIMARLVEAMTSNLSVALIFGPEPNGLTNDEVTRCHHLLEISTGEDYPSLNLAQAVAITLYELHKAWSPPPVPPDQGDQAPFAAQERMFAQLRIALEKIHFLYGDKADSLMHAVRHLLGKARLTTMEVNVLMGLARQINWHVERHPCTGEDLSPAT